MHAACQGSPSAGSSRRLLLLLLAAAAAAWRAAASVAAAASSLKLRCLAWLQRGECACSLPGPAVGCQRLAGVSLEVPEQRCCCCCCC
jgi:hypothetical protein